MKFAVINVGVLCTDNSYRHVKRVNRYHNRFCNVAAIARTGKDKIVCVGIWSTADDHLIRI